MQLDHATLVTPDLDSARRFFVGNAGLAEGPRPPFSVDVVVGFLSSNS